MGTDVTDSSHRRQVPTIALSAHWQTYPERFRWIAEQGFALEYSPNPEAFEALPQHVHGGGARLHGPPDTSPALIGR